MVSSLKKSSVAASSAEDVESGEDSGDESEEESLEFESYEESTRTEDYEDATESMMSDSSTMYSASEGERLQAKIVFKEKPWWETEEGGGRGSPERQVPDDVSEVSEATETLDMDGSEISEMTTEVSQGSIGEPDHTIKFMRRDRELMRRLGNKGEDEDDEEEEEEDEEDEEEADDLENEEEEEQEKEEAPSIERKYKANEDEDEAEEECESESEELKSEDEIEDMPDEELEETDLKLEELDEEIETSPKTEDVPVQSQTTGITEETKRANHKEEPAQANQEPVREPVVNAEEKASPNLEKVETSITVSRGRSLSPERTAGTKTETVSKPDEIHLKENTNNIDIEITNPESLTEHLLSVQQIEGNLQKSDSQTSGYDSSLSLSESKARDLSRDSGCDISVGEAEKAIEREAKNESEKETGMNTDKGIPVEPSETIEIIPEENGEQTEGNVKVQSTIGNKIIIQLKLESDTAPDNKAGNVSDKAEEQEQLNERKREKCEEPKSYAAAVKEATDKPPLQKKVVDETPSESKDLDSLEDVADQGVAKESADKVVVNKMDACLAKVDASLAWVDARLTRDGHKTSTENLPQKDVEKEKVTYAGIVKSGAKINIPQLIDKKSKQSTSSDKKPQPHPQNKTKSGDSLVVLKVQAHVPEEHTKEQENIKDTCEPTETSSEQKKTEPSVDVKNTSSSPTPPSQPKVTQEAPSSSITFASEQKSQTLPPKDTPDAPKDPQTKGKTSTTMVTPTPPQDTEQQGAQARENLQEPVSQSKAEASQATRRVRPAMKEGKETAEETTDIPKTKREEPPVIENVPRRRERRTEDNTRQNSPSDKKEQDPNPHKSQRRREESRTEHQEEQQKPSPADVSQGEHRRRRRGESRQENETQQRLSPTNSIVSEASTRPHEVRRRPESRSEDKPQQMPSSTDVNKTQTTTGVRRRPESRKEEIPSPTDINLTEVRRRSRTEVKAHDESSKEPFLTNAQGGITFIDDLSTPQMVRRRRPDTAPSDSSKENRPADNESQDAPPRRGSGEGRSSPERSSPELESALPGLASSKTLWRCSTYETMSLSDYDNLAFMIRKSRSAPACPDRRRRRKKQDLSGSIESLDQAKGQTPAAESPTGVSPQSESPPTDESHRKQGERSPGSPPRANTETTTTKTKTTPTPTVTTPQPPTPTRDDSQRRPSSRTQPTMHESPPCKAEVPEVPSPRQSPEPSKVVRTRSVTNSSRRSRDRDSPAAPLRTRDQTLPKQSVDTQVADHRAEQSSSSSTNAVQRSTNTALLYDPDNKERRKIDSPATQARPSQVPPVQQGSGKGRDAKPKSEKPRELSSSLAGKTDPVRKSSSCSLS
nr:serine/arginine repetitive matrix protein 2-like [Penaeus vannamei]